MNSNEVNYLAIQLKRQKNLILLKWYIEKSAQCNFQLVQVQYEIFNTFQDVDFHSMFHLIAGSTADFNKKTE
jgi:hypothetical protein